MRHVGNIFRDIGQRVRPAMGRLGGRAVQRGEQHLAYEIDERLPPLADEDDEDDAPVASAPRGRSMPPATRGEVLDATQGLVDVLAGMPQTRGVQAALAGVGALMGEVTRTDRRFDGDGDGLPDFDSMNERQLRAYVKARTREQGREGRQSAREAGQRSRQSARQAVRNDRQDDQDDAAGSFLGHSEQDQWGDHNEADQFGTEGLVTIGNVLDQWGPGLWDTEDTFMGDDVDQFGSGYDDDEIDQFGDDDLDDDGEDDDGASGFVSIGNVHDFHRGR